MEYPMDTEWYQREEEDHLTQGRYNYNNNSFVKVLKLLLLKSTDSFLGPQMN
jgi:hypothetical protein